MVLLVWYIIKDFRHALDLSGHFQLCFSITWGFPIATYTAAVIFVYGLYHEMPMYTLKKFEGMQMLLQI